MHVYCIYSHSTSIKLANISGLTKQTENIVNYIACTRLSSCTKKRLRKIHVFLLGFKNKKCTLLRIVQLLFV